MALVEAELGAGIGAVPSRRVLIVEDEFLLAMAMQQALEMAGYLVVGVAADATGAVALAAQTRPDLLVSDIKLRGQRDGVTVAVELRESLDLPCIFVSGTLDPVTRARAAKARPLGFVEKPYAERHLLATIESAFEAIERARGGAGAGVEILLRPTLPG